MLFAQGCNSPRLAISLLWCFNYRWNIERSFDNEDLPKFYRGWCSQWNVEEVQDATEDWYDEPVHGDWISTKEFVSTGEKCYLISKGDGGDDNKVDDVDERSPRGSRPDNSDDSDDEGFHDCEYIDIRLCSGEIRARLLQKAVMDGQGYFREQPSRG